MVYGDESGGVADFFHPTMNFCPILDNLIIQRWAVL